MKRIKGLCCAAVMMLCGTAGMVPGFPLPDAPLSAKAAASDYTAEDAINWVKSKNGKTLEVNDPSNYAQCVDLTMGYYDFLGVPRCYGNGNQYSYMDSAVPAGWTRTQGGIPQKGDILVYANNANHVAIYESDYSTWHQNFNKHSYVEQITNQRYDSWGYWGCIHPNFKDTTLFAAPGNNYEPTQFSWAAIANAKHYNLRIFNGKAWESEELYSAWEIKDTTYQCILPAGHYSAYIDTVFGDDSYQMSNLIEFDVKQVSTFLTVKQGSNLEPTVFSWKEAQNAAHYNLRIYNGKLWEAEELYSAWDIADITYQCELPVGHYEAYIDTVYTDNNYLISNIIAFDVKEISTVLSVTPGSSLTETVFRWQEAPNAKHYNLRIYNGKLWESEELYSAWEIKDTAYKCELSAGHYEAYIDTVFSDDSFLISNIIGFDVEEGTAVIPPAPAIKYGDVNDDGSVDLKDVTQMRRKLAGWDVTINETAADVNKDGSFDLKDVVTLRRYLAGGWGIEL